MKKVPEKNPEPFWFNKEHRLVSAKISNAVNQLFGIIPAKTGIGDGFAVNAAAYFLAAFHDIAFHHYTFDQFMDIGI